MTLRTLRIKPIAAGALVVAGLVAGGCGGSDPAPDRSEGDGGQSQIAARVAADATAEVQLLIQGDIVGWCAVTDPDGVASITSVTATCADTRLAPSAAARLTAWRISADAVRVFDRTASIDTADSSLGTTSAGQHEVAAVLQADGHWALNAGYLADFGIFEG